MHRARDLRLGANRRRRADNGICNDDHGRWRADEGHRLIDHRL